MFQVIKQPINSKVLITPIILLLSILVGYITATQGLNYRLIMIFGALIIGAITLILGEKGIRIGFIGWLVMFSLGYRTLSFETTYLTGNSLSTLVKSRFQIHPLVVLIFLLWILIIIQSSGSVRFSSKSILPGILWIFCVFWVWGLILGGLKGIEIKDMLSDLLNFLIIIPVFVTSQFVLKKKQFWKFSLLIFYLTSTFIALMGAIEYLFPQVKTRFAGFFTSVNSVIDSVGFARAAFSFWGSPIAIFVIILSLPFIIVLWKWYKSIIMRVILLLCTSLILYGIYIAGYRSMWAVTMILSIILAISSKNIKFIIVVLASFFIIYLIIPPVARERFALFTDSVSGNLNKTMDSSSVKRTHRAEEAFTFALQNPLGGGWASSGWVHSDFIQLAADIGLLGSGIFILWYLKTLLALIRQYIKTSDTLTLALIGAFFIIGAQFLFEAIYVLTQLIAPVWFIWAMAEIKLRNPNGDTPEPELQNRIAL